MRKLTRDVGIYLGDNEDGERLEKKMELAEALECSAFSIEGCLFGCSAL